MSDSPPDLDVVLLAEGDAERLDRVRDDVFDHGVDPERTRAFLADPANFLVVALDGDTVVGMATGFSYLHPDKPRQLFVNEVAVSEAYRRRGLGRRMMATLLAEAKRRGCAEAWVATDASNAAGRALFGRSAGGIEESERAVVFTYRFGKAPGGRNGT